VGATDRYASPAAFRAALEHRLRREAQRSSVTLQRLRKEAAYHRLLYRLQRAAPDSWAIKGGFALILRLGRAGTRDPGCRRELAGHGDLAGGRPIDCRGDDRQ
jgi:hypothetical protein